LADGVRIDLIAAGIVWPVKYGISGVMTFEVIR
jgi:hypothetical protein